MFKICKNFHHSKISRYKVCTSACMCVCVFVCVEYIGLTLNINSIIVELMMKSLGLHCIRQAPPKRQHLPARLQNIAANHCHAVTWGSSCDQISITLSCDCRDMCSSSCPNDKLRKFHSLLIFLGQLYNSQEKEGEIIPWKYKKMKEIYLENNDRTSGRERTLQWTDKVSLHHTKTWSGHEHMTTSLVTQPHYTTLSNDMVIACPQWVDQWKKNTWITLPSYTQLSRDLL